MRARPSPSRGRGKPAGVLLLALAAALAVPSRAEITLRGTLAVTPVGRDLLGRALSGAGDPRDGLPPPIGEALAPISGAPLNPMRRLPPRDFIETGITAIDGLNTLVRGQKLPVFSCAGLPSKEDLPDPKRKEIAKTRVRLVLLTGLSPWMISATGPDQSSTPLVQMTGGMNSIAI